MTTFTGSTGVGRMVAQAAAKDLKKVSLELGGKNPQVVFPDADLDAALEKVVFGAYFNQGECCNAGSRLLVHADIADEFTARVVERAQDVTVGDPLDPATKVGALISESISAWSAAMSILVSRRAPRSRWAAIGWPPIAGVTTPRPCSPAYPRRPGSLARRSSGLCCRWSGFADLDEAVEITNATTGSAVCGAATSTPPSAMHGPPRPEPSGSTATWTVSFGGYGASGIGRELGRTAIDEYIEHKSTIIRTGGQAPSWVGGVGEK